MKHIDHTGHQFGRLTVLSKINHRDTAGRPQVKWRCICECGNETIVHGGSLRRGDTVSCGCYMDESRRLRGIKHGAVGTKLYNTWLNIRARCGNPDNPAYKDYGARGIRVWVDWDISFEAFAAYVGAPPSAQHSIGRINNDLGYVPGNVRWETAHEQSINKRNTVQITVRNETMPLRVAADRFGVAYDTLHYRVRDGGWTAEQAVGIDPPPPLGGYKWGDKKRRRFGGEIVHAGRER